MEIPTTPDELNTTSLDIARAEVEDKPIRAETETQARARAIIAVTQARAEANDRDRAQAARAQSEVHVSTASLPATGTAVVRPPLVRDNTPDEYEKSPLLGAHI